MLLLVESVAKGMSRRMSLLRVPTPFVLPREPSWLVEPLGRAPETETKDARGRPRWEQRRLLFFAGHVPKLYFSTTRYLLWDQLRRDERATTSSYDINCTVLSYKACELSRSELGTKSELWFRSFCAPYCPGRRECLTIRKGTGNNSSTRLAAFRAAFDRQCHHYRRVDFSAAEHMRRDSAVRLSRTDYLRMAVQHRFCLVAMGDQDGTPKITEMVAIGGAGGCVPVIVLPRDGSPTEVSRVLPHSSWLDYCRIAWLVPARSATRNGGMARVLDQLGRVTAEEAASRSRELQWVRHAFVWREQGHGSGRASDRRQLSAADYVLGEICERARLARGGVVGSIGSPADRVAGGNHERCLLS
jgi:hypothetical protein